MSEMFSDIQGPTVMHSVYSLYRALTVTYRCAKSHIGRTVIYRNLE